MLKADDRHFSLVAEHDVRSSGEWRNRGFSCSYRSQSLPRLPARRHTLVGRGVSPAPYSLHRQEASTRATTALPTSS